ncbi:MAG: hypothetical protein J6T63_05680 [Bacteroidales bacterium]|nr:hypothetical protein [Bacteroidales bacterium]
MKQKIVIGIFIGLFVANALVSFAGGHFPPNGKKCEVGGKVIYVDKTCMTNLGWREMLWFLENKPKEFSGVNLDGSVSENCVDSAVWKHVYGDRIGEKNLKQAKVYNEMDGFPVVGFSLKQCRNYMDFRAAAVMDVYNYSKPERYKGVKLEYFMLSSEQYAELLKQKWFAKSFVDGYAEITSDGKFVKNGKILDSVDDDKVTFRMYAVVGND